MLERNSTTSEFLHQLFEQKGCRLTPEVELSSNDLLIDLAHIGLGIAFVPDFMMPSAPEGLIVLDMKEELPKRQLLLVHNERIPATFATKSFLRLLTLDQSFI